MICTSLDTHMNKVTHGLSRALPLSLSLTHSVYQCTYTDTQLLICASLFSLLLCSWPLADEKSPKEASLLIHVNGRGVAHGDKQVVTGREREQPSLVGRVQGKLGGPGPAGGTACLHQ